MVEFTKSLVCSVVSPCIRRPPIGDTFSPYIKIKFEVSGTSITVGNESSPTLDHRVTIKDFEFGHGKGYTCRVTIHDEFGGSFTKFMEDILKDAKCITPEGGVTMEVEFGWISSICGGGGGGFAERLPGYIEKSPVYYMMCSDIMCNFAGGKFMYEITGVDTLKLASDAKFTKVYGGEGQDEMFLKEAIAQMFKDGPEEGGTTPVVKHVRFLKIGKGSCGGSPEEVGFIKSDKGDKMKGPTGKWAADNVDKLTAAMNWLKDYNSENNRGWIPAFNSQHPEGELIFWEDPKPKCGEDANWEQTALGQYVVNGGQDSRVIEFNPKIKWMFSSLTNAGGSMGDAQAMANQNGGKNAGLEDCESLQRKTLGDMGSQTTSAANENSVNRDGKEANKETAKAQAEQQRAFTAFKLDYQGPIEADLVVVGEPTLLRPAECIMRNLWIIFFNPFFITPGAGDGHCGDWLSVPPPGCNPILSNKAWQIRQIVHRINDGKFVTNFQVFLMGPGMDLNVGEPVGGLGSGGWIPPKNC